MVVWACLCVGGASENFLLKTRYINSLFDLIWFDHCQTTFLPTGISSMLTFSVSIRFFFFNVSPFSFNPPLDWLRSFGLIFLAVVHQLFIIDNDIFSFWQFGVGGRPKLYQLTDTPVRVLMSNSRKIMINQFSQCFQAMKKLIASMISVK